MMEDIVWAFSPCRQFVRLTSGVIVSCGLHYVSRDVSCEGDCTLTTAVLLQTQSIVLAIHVSPAPPFIVVSAYSERPAWRH